MTETLSNEALKHAKVLWDYHRLQPDLSRSDFTLAMGSHDERVAIRAAEVYLAGFAPVLVVSGGYGKVTRDTASVTEADRFAEIAMTLGVPREAIVLEREAANTGDNIIKTRDVLEITGLPAASGILVTKPYMSRRALATAQKQWPEVRWTVTAPQVEFDEYPNSEVPIRRTIELMVGDLQRLEVYADKGFQVPQDIPGDVWKSYEILRNAGFDRFVIKDVA